jgi:hypothetical protein
MLTVTFACAGCIGRTEPLPYEPVPSSSTAYPIDRCASFVGATALIGAHCDGDDTIATASCDVNGGKLDSSHGDARSWQCDSTWTDTARGGELCAHLVCEHKPAPVADVGATVTVTITCEEADGAAIPCFGDGGAHGR